MKVESGNPEVEQACSWFMVWASLLLTNIYLFRTNQLRKAFDLQMEIERMIPGGDSDELRSLRNTLRIARFTTLYQYCDSHLKNPTLKEKAVRDFGRAHEPNHDDKASENYQLTELFYAYLDNGNYRAALSFIQEAKQYLSSQDKDGLSKNVELEACCCINLGLGDATNNVFKDYKMATRTPASKFSPRTQRMVKVGFNAQKLVTLENSQGFSSRSLEKQQRISEILKAISNDNKRWNWEFLDKGVQSLEDSYGYPVDIRILILTPASENSDLDYGDYLLLSGLRTGLCLIAIEA